MKKLVLLATGLLLIGSGCSYKYESEWNTQDLNGPATTTSATTSNSNQGATPSNKPSGYCTDAGQQAGDAPCCPGLEEVAVDDGYSICGKPPGYKPRVCAAPGEMLTQDTQNCCAGLEAEEVNGHWICQQI